MAYRLLFLDRLNGVVHACDLQAGDDAEALQSAEGMRGLSAMELWEGGRKVKRWECFPPD